MKIEVSRKDLETALSLNGKAVSSKPFVPLLGGVLFSVTQNQIRMSTTNYEIGVDVVLEGGSNTPFETVVPYQIFSKLISTVRDDKLEVEFDDKNKTLSVSSATSKNKLQCNFAEDFPPFPNFDSGEESIMEFAPNEFSRLIERIAFCAHAEEVAGLNTVNFVGKQGNLEVFAVDGFHLSHETFALKNNFAFDVSVKAQSISTIAKMVGNQSVKVYLQEKQSKIIFAFGNCLLYCSLVNSNHFDPAQLLKLPDAETIINLNADNFLHGCQQLELFCPEENSGSLLETEGLLLRQSVNYPEMGSSVIYITPTLKIGEAKLKIGVRLLLQFLEICETEEISMQIINDKSPIRFSMVGLSNFTHIIMPIA